MTRRRGLHDDLMFLLIVLAGMTLWGCDKGLSPETLSSPLALHAIRGTIVFRNWPPVDSVRDLRLAALKDLPSENIISEVIAGRARYTETLPYHSDSFAYTLYLAPLTPGEYKYIGVAQQYGPNVQADWRIVGVYYANGDSTNPGIVDVPADSIVSGIDITVDFFHLPPQPF